MAIRLIRHGESFANIGEKRWDSPLTEKGITQSSKLKGHYDLVILSPMRRAQETYIYSQIDCDECVYCESCREIKKGISDHLLFESLKRETEDEFETRINLLMEELRNYSQKYKNIVVFTHGGVIRNICKLDRHVENCESIIMTLD